MTQTMIRDVEKLIARQISEGNFRSFDDALVALQSIVSDQNILDKVHSAWLQNEISKGEASGGELPATEVFAEARSRIRGER